MTNQANTQHPLNTPASAPWYRHRWPWLLMAGPAVVVVASFITLWLAVHTDDGLVTENYYRQGLAINQTLKLSERARELGLEAGLRIGVDQISVRLAAADARFAPPETIQVSVAHPTRAGLDQTQTLTRQGARYVGRFRLPADGHWTVMIEDAAKTWLMMGNIVLPASEEQVFGGVILPEETQSPATSKNQTETSRY